MSVQISDEQLEKLLRASSPYPPNPSEGTTLRQQRILDDITQGRPLSARTAVRRGRGRIIAATVAIASVALIVVGVVSALTVQPVRDLVAATSEPTAPIESTTPAPPSKSDLQTIDGRTFSAVGPGNCTTNAAISTPWHGDGDEPVKLLGDLTDMGATEYAAGSVGYNADGQIQTYTVEAGDSLISIGERFCIDYITVAVYNHRTAPGKTIQPGDILVLRPDPTAPWTPTRILPTAGWMPEGQVVAAQRMYAAAATYFGADEATVELPLPDGYIWPAGADSDIASDGFPDVQVWYDWVAAHADAAVHGDETAAATLADMSIPLGQAFDARVRVLIDDRDYAALLELLPLPTGMRP